MVWAAVSSRAAGSAPLGMSRRKPERIPPLQRMRSALDFGRMREKGRPLRGAHCLVVVEARPGEPTKVAFVASRKAVGNAVRRNRARRRLREIVRRRWPEIAG